MYFHLPRRNLLVKFGTNPPHDLTLLIIVALVVFPQVFNLNLLQTWANRNVANIANHYPIQILVVPQRSIRYACTHNLQCYSVCFYVTKQFNYITVHVVGWAKDMDFLWNPWVCGPWSYSEQGPWHQRRLLVPWCSHVWAPHWYVNATPKLKRFRVKTM